MPVATVSNALIAAIVDGAGVPELATELGIADAQLRDVTARTSIVTLARLWRRALRVTGDDCLGLHIGTVVPGARFGLAARAAIEADDFRAMLQRFATYAALINDLLVCTLDGATLTVKLRWDVLGLERHAVDLTLAGVIASARAQLPAPVIVREVRLRHRLTATRARYEALFAAPVVLGASHNQLVLDPALLAARPRARDPELGQILDRYAALSLAERPVVGDFPAEIAQLVRRQLRAGAPIELPAIAAQVALPARTLQRRLRTAGTSLSAIIDGVRRALAPELLADPARTVDQIGAQLGYSEPTAFIRAFKKWFGTTPGASRQA